MRKDLSRISCVLTLVLAAHAAWAQPDLASVTGDSVKVYRDMSTRSEVASTLKAGEVVQVGFSITGEEGSWCRVSRVDPPAELGYVLCDQLARQPQRQDAAPPRAPSAVAPGECSRVAEQVFKAAGLDDTIAGFSAAVRSTFEDRLSARVSPAAKRRLTEAVRTAFSPANMGYRVKRELADSCDVESFEQVIAGLTSPLGAKIARMEKSAAGGNVSAQMSEYAGTIARHPPTPERLRLMQRVDDSIGYSAFAADVIVTSARGLTAAFGGLGPVDDSLRARVFESMHQQNLVSLLFTYRAASDREVAQYIDLNETPAFRRFNDRFKKAFLDSVGEQSQELGLEMKKLKESGVGN